QPVAVEPVTIQVNKPFFNPFFFLSAPLKKKMKKDIELAAKEIHTSVKEIKEVTPAIFSSALQTASNELEDIHFNEDIFQAKKVQIDTTPLFASIRSIPKR
ncbi:hypothetical protein LZ318_01555, partial [Saccharopolyspora indica]|uniref:hypothetical protein n=1 Tax=Saccharopolyspora indica TaxID=1229659 RepID=UPI002FE529AB